MPRLRKARSSSLELFSSSTGTRCLQALDDRDVGAEGLPRGGELDADDAAAQDDRGLGTRSRTSAWSEEMMRLPSISRPGSDFGTEPVASRM